MKMIYDHPLKREIYKKGFTIESFADYIGINRATIFNMCKKICRTRGETIYLISEGLGMPYERVEQLCRMNK